MKTISAILIIALIGLSFYWKTDPVKNIQKRVVIDVGHGGEDYGGVVGDVSEKDLVMAIAQQIRELNANENFEVILLRADDCTLSITDRFDRILELKPDLVLVLHANLHSDKNENGYEIFISPENEHYEQSRSIAEKLLDKMTNDQLATRSIKSSNFTIIQKAPCPAVHLEVGFLSNVDDRQYMLSERGQKEIARNILAGLE